MKTNIHTRIKGFSLIEVLLVLTIFSFFTIILSQSLILVLSGTRKTDSGAEIRENLSHIIGVMEKELRGAKAITSDCDNSPRDSINYITPSGIAGIFVCNNKAHPIDSNIASGSAGLILTSDNLRITVCDFICSPGSSGNPPSVSITLVAENERVSGKESAQVSVSTKIMLRTY